MRSPTSHSNRRCISLLALTALTACTINPVTGDREIALVSEADELAIGAAQYAPSRQMQGGEYALDPGLTAYVAQVGQRLAAVSDRSLPYEFAVINSSVPNAWALPGGKIAINRGLLVELSSEAELAAVLGHEIVHAAARHGAQAMQRGLLLQSAVLITGIAARSGDYSNLVVGAASVGAQLINQRHSRGAELESDEFGMRYMSRAGYDPTAAITLQRTFVRLSENRREAGWLAGLFASHPPSMERVERNVATRAQLPAGGETGETRYQAAIRTLTEHRVAYETHDRGRAALADGRLEEAKTLANQSIADYPDEAQFHALRGDVAFAEASYDEAAAAFRAAIARQDEFFYYPLRLGQSLVELGQLAAAQPALQTSLDLLPTADGHYALGRALEQRGDIGGALEHYRAAASSSSEAGRSAGRAVVRIDLPNNPGNYLRLRTSLDSQRRLLVEIANPTDLPITDIGLTIRFIGADGQQSSVRRNLAFTLTPGGAQGVNTALGPFASDADYQVVISSARVIEE